jgi:Kae1-associated kinase Bud32
MSYIQGAEAQVTASQWRGRQVVLKTRLPKAYRHPDLDARLRLERTRDEANLLIQARRAGVRVPIVYDLDRAGSSMVLEALDGIPLRAALHNAADEDASQMLRQLGAMVGVLHDAGLCHGDLTTSNVLCVKGSLFLIDFGLGQFGEDDEARGVDVHLVEEALEATDSRSEELMTAFLAGYQPACRKHVLKRLDEIRKRGRYRDGS